MQTLDTTITSTSTQPTHSVAYLDLSCGAALFGIRAEVKMDARVLAEYQEIDAALGHNTVGAVLSNLACRVVMGEDIGDERMSVCLARRDTGQNVEVDLALLHRVRPGHENYFIRYMGEHDLVTDEL